MKKIYTLLILLMATGCAWAQNYTTYFMEGSTMRSQWNPAFAPQRGYLNIPALGNVQASINGNIALDHIFYPQDGKLYTLLSANIPASLALSGLEDMNRTGADVSLNLIGFGAYTKNHKNFWSVDVSVKTAAELRAPYELFDFFKTGTSGSFANLGVDLNSFVETSFAYSLPILENLYIGARVKFLVGIGSLGFNFDRFDASMGADRWYANAIGTLDVAGFQLETERLDDGTLVYDLEDVEFDDVSIPAGYGFGMDIGATYDLLPNLQFSLSINDLGFMAWSKKSTSTGRVDKELEFTGIEIDAAGNATQPSFDLDELNFEVIDAEAKTKALRMSINAGAEYNVLDRRIGFGLFYHMHMLKYKTLHAITGSVNFRPFKWLHASGSYTITGKYGNSFGLGLNICPGFVNLFVGTDLLLCKKSPQWIPTKQHNMQVTFGLGIPLGPKGERHE